MESSAETVGATDDPLVVLRGWWRRQWRRRGVRLERIGTVGYGRPERDEQVGAIDAVGAGGKAGTGGAAGTAATDPTGPEAEAVGVRIRFAFEPLAAPWSCVALFLRMSFDDVRIEVLDAGTDPALGPVSVSGLSSNVVGWYFDGLSGAAPSEVIARATLSVPEDLTELTGTVRAELSVVRAGLLLRRKAHARTPRIREFALPVAGRPAVTGTGVPVTDSSISATGTGTVVTDSSALATGAGAAVTGTSTPVTGTGASALSTPATPAADAAPPPQEPEAAASVRLCVAADIERYSRFRTPEAVRAQQRLTDALARARHHAGIDERRVHTQESGDGQFVVLPTGLDESEVIPALVHGFRIALAEANADLNERARLRLRIALHRGHIERGANGWAGDSAVAVHRILDSPPARGALGDNPDADFVLIVPDMLYQDVIAHGYGLLRPESFTQVEVKIPAKNFADTAWIYVPQPW